MKHRALSMLLALLMVVSLLPIAAVAGDEGVSTTAEIYEGNLRMRYNNSNGNEMRLPVGKYVVGLRVTQDSTNETHWLTDNDIANLQVDGKVIRSIKYTRAASENTELCWTIEVVGQDGDRGCIYYGGDMDHPVNVFVVDNSQSSDNKLSTGTLVVQHSEKDYAAGSNLVLPVGRNEIVLMLPTDQGWDYLGQDALNGTEEKKLSCGGSASITLAPPAEQDDTPIWGVTINGNAEEGDSGWIQYGDDSNRVTITVGSTPQPNPELSGQLEINYDNGFTSNISFDAGTYDVELHLRDKENNSVQWLGKEFESQLSVDGIVVRSIAEHEFKNGEGENRFFWTIELAEPQGEQTTGWIQYGTDESNRVTITVKPSHGGAVGPETTIYKDGSYEFDWASWGTIMPFEWKGATYYLGTAEWKSTVNEMASPYAGERGVNEAEAFYAACVFELKSGEAGNRNATYALREDIRKEMMDQKFQFQLTLVPTDIGCKYYPIIEKVQKTVTWDKNSGENGSLTSEWQGQKFSKASVGLWVYDARIIDPDGKQYQQNLNNCMYTYTTKTEVKLDAGNVDSINKQIEDAIGDSSGQAGNGLYDGMVTFILPSGEIEGQIVIPKTDYMISVFGNGLENGSITTTIKGGIRFDNDNTNHVGYIHFIGAGRDNPWANEEKTVLNEAINGIGQGAPENCVFEEYDIAIHSSTRLSWGSLNSIYLNNNVAICQNSTNGGQPFMQNNWFVGNAIAVMLKEVPVVGNLRTFQNRFVNNGTDFGNETGKPYDSKTGSILWVSENFFYHDSSWQPQKSDLWSEKNGVIYLNYNREGMLLVPNAPSFDETGDYKDDIEAYKAFLPRFSGWTPVYAYPLARSQFCDTFFYPNRRDPSYCPQWWPDSDPYYPSYVRQGSTISTSELDGLRFSSYDSETDTAVGTFEFSASAAETEN